MFPNYVNQVFVQNQRKRCECYLKVDSLGVPLYGSDDEEDNLDSHTEIPYEYAHQPLGLLTINPEVTEYPIVEDEELFTVFLKMTKVIPSLSDFEINLLNFWMLDMFIEGLNTAQKAKFSHEHQKIVLEWIAYFFNYIESYKPSRKALFSHLKMLLFIPEGLKSSKTYPEYYDEYYGEMEESISDGQISFDNAKKKWEFPLPPDVERISSKASNVSEDEFSKTETETAKSYNSLTSHEKNNLKLTRRNIHHTQILLEILYRIFGRLWVFQEIQTVFRSKPNVTRINLPLKLNVPKPMYSMEPPTATKFGKRVSISEKPFEESENQLRRHDCIFPLQVSEDAKSYLKQSNYANDRFPIEKGKGKK